MVKTLTLLTFLLGSAQRHEAPLQVASAALRENSPIPTRYTCRGKNISIPLRWRHIPPGTRSLVIIMTDENVPKDKRYLWAVYNIPPQLRYLKPNMPLVRGEQHAINSWGHTNYDGPCPMKGHRHRYVVKLYALNTRLYFDKTVHAPQLKDAMHKHVIAAATIESWYSVATMTVRRRKSATSSQH